MPTSGRSRRWSGSDSPGARRSTFRAILAVRRSPLRPLDKLLLAAVLLLPASASAYDYLEHSWFTDRACLEAQRRLGPALEAGGSDLTARYLALSLACPERWDRVYCASGYKQAEGGLNRLTKPPVEGGEHPATLGDFSALGDHLTQWGPVRGLAQASGDGLTAAGLGWLGRDGDAGGVVADVAEDACETELVPWADVERDVADTLARADAAGGLPALSARGLTASRAEVPRGPHDPAAKYSFDNPYFLDLVRQNQGHFAPGAHANWLGYRAAAASLARQGCSDVLALDEDDLEDLADGLPAFEEIDWDALPDEPRRRRGCELVAERIRIRLGEWSRRADPALVAPARAALASIEQRSPEGAALLDRVASALMGAFFAAGGLHYLQDSLSSGHLRMVSDAQRLGDSRYLHDYDCQHGVLGSFESRAGARDLVFYGDSYLLGPQLGTCAPEERERGGPRNAAACSIAEQRGLLVAASAAALLDFALDGDGAAPPGGCAAADPARRFGCLWLPVRSPSSAGLPPPSAPAALGGGTLPVPPPPFTYESMVITSALDGAGDAAQVGVRLSLFSALDDRADWMTSYRFGAAATLRPAGPELTPDFGFFFHWRWAARFLVNAGASAFAGFRGIGSQDMSLYLGVAPSAGVSAFPEGWIKLPLEISLSYKLPLTLLDSRDWFTAKAIGIEAHWIELGVGLEFM